MHHLELDILECPECNVRPNVLTVGKCFQVRCPNCGSYVNADCQTVEQAVATWNRIAASMVPPEDEGWTNGYRGEQW